MPSIAVIGAGAAGCFCVAELRKTVPELSIAVFEAAPKAMAKLSVTGGGRCNLTNSFEGIHSLAEAYPRGEKLMKRALKVFSQEDTLRWFENEGVPLVLQDDHCWFPRSQKAMDIVHCLQKRKPVDGTSCSNNHVIKCFSINKSPATFGRNNPFHRRAKPQVHSAEMLFQAVDNIHRLLRTGEPAVVFLKHQPNAFALKPLNCIFL